MVDALALAASVCSVLIAATVVAILVATAQRREWRGLGVLRKGSPLACGALLAAALLVDAPGWAVGVDATAFVAAVQACALRSLQTRDLRDYAAMAPSRGGREPGWWREFEREFNARTRPPSRRARSRDSGGWG